MIVVGLGGNVGTDEEIVGRFRRAREALGASASARLYRSAPIGPQQPAYLNSAIALAGELELATLHEVERSLGRDRVREVRFGPRTIDLDVLAWDDRTIDTPDLVVPHPRLVERRFALLPLIDLVGVEFRVAGTTLGELARRVVAQSVELVTDAW